MRINRAEEINCGICTAVSCDQPFDFGVTGFQHHHNNKSPVCNWFDRSLILLQVTQSHYVGFVSVAEIKQSLCG